MAQDLSSAQRTLTVGVLGAGTVGSQVIRLLTEQADDFTGLHGEIDAVDNAARSIVLLEPFGFKRVDAAVQRCNRG